MPDEPKPSDPTPATRDKIVLFSFSLVLLVGLAALNWANPTFTPQQWFTNLCILALAAGGFAAFLPGALDWQVSPQMRATGAIAFVILVLVLGMRIEGPQIQSRKWSLVTPEGEPPDPHEAAVYVSLEDEIVRAVGTHKPEFKIAETKFGKDINVERGVGGIVVHVPRAAAGQRLSMFVEDQGKWWISNEVLVPPTDELKLRATTLEALRRKVK